MKQCCLTPETSGQTDQRLPRLILLDQGARALEDFKVLV